MWQNNIRFPSQNVEPNSVLLPDGLTYQDKILSTIPGIYALYPLNETSGITAYDVVNGYNAQYFGPTLGAIAGPGASMDNAAFYDGAVDKAVLPAAPLDGPFDPNLGTLLIWWEMFNAGVWTDATGRFVVTLGNNNSNRIYVWKHSNNNTLRFGFSAGGTAANVEITISTIDWMCLAVTWSKPDNRVRHYLNGTQQGATQPYTGTWVGALANDYCQIAATGISSYGRGYPSFLALSNQEATPAQIAAASVAS